jgi:hypothetical protein
MLSYPSGPAFHKVMDRPDMHVLAALGEAAGLDVRFIVLLRDAASILQSTIDRRHFGGNMQPQVLIANAESMHTQLTLVSPAFYRCLHYDKLLTGALNTSELHKFLHPGAISEAVLSAMLAKVHQVAHGETKPVTDNKLRSFHSAQLQARIDTIEALCTKSGSWL